jgi:tRNA wybutosine-synthesizing protein 4
MSTDRHKDALFGQLTEFLANTNNQEPILLFRKVPEYSPIFQQRATIARFGAAVVNHQGHCYIIGGIVQNELLTASNEICILNLKESTTLFSPIKVSSSLPRPLLVGFSVWSAGDTLLIMGGSAVCFSFGTFWNKGCFTLNNGDDANHSSRPAVVEHSSKAPQHWKYLHTVAPMPARMPMAGGVPPIALASQSLVGLPRVRVESPSDFNQILDAANPAIIEGLNIGPCTKTWTKSYLKERVGVEREV